MQEREQLLSFVVVGGGPTGVEVAAELHDMVADDLRKIYPELMPYVRIRVIELQDHVLSTYDREISKYTAQEFSRQARPPRTKTPLHAVSAGRCGAQTVQHPCKAKAKEEVDNLPAWQQFTYYQATVLYWQRPRVHACSSQPALQRRNLFPKGLAAIFKQTK